MESFRKEFVSFQGKMIVCHPKTERYFWHIYPYYPLSEMVEKWNFSKKDEQKIQELLSVVGRERCEVCKITANTIYFPVVKYVEDAPVFSSLISGKHLCAEHAFEKIQETLSNNKHAFDDQGPFAPYGGDGVFISTAL